MRHRVRGWTFQSSLLGGRLALGGVVADFLFSPPDWVPPRVWRVQGEYFHFASTQAQMHDVLQRLTLENRGFIVVDLISTDIYNSRDAVLDAALQGRQLRATPILV